MRKCLSGLKISIQDTFTWNCMPITSAVQNVQLPQLPIKSLTVNLSLSLAITV